MTVCKCRASREWHERRIETSSSVRCAVRCLPARHRFVLQLADRVEGRRRGRSCRNLSRRLAKDRRHPTRRGRSSVAARDRPSGHRQRATVTAATRRLGHRLSRESLVGPLDAAPTSPEEIAVHQALGRLSEHDLEVLLLVEWEGLRPSELGRVLGCEEVTARGRLHRARSRFREEFQTVLEQQADFASDQGLVTPGTFKQTTRKAQA